MLFIYFFKTDNITHTTVLEPWFHKGGALRVFSLIVWGDAKALLLAAGAPRLFTNSNSTFCSKPTLSLAFRLSQSSSLALVSLLMKAAIDS